MTVRYMPRTDDALWGIQFENGTWTGITREMMRNYSYIAAGNIWYKCHMLQEVDCFTPHVVDSIKWLVPCAQPYPRWSSLTRVF